LRKWLNLGEEYESLQKQGALQLSLFIVLEKFLASMAKKWRTAVIKIMSNMFEKKFRYAKIEEPDGDNRD
jgi:hypothetical protein